LSVCANVAAVSLSYFFLSSAPPHAARRVDIESLPLLGAAARIHAGRTYGRQCARQSAAASTPSSSSPSPPFAAFATVSAAFLPFTETRSGPIAVSDRLSCSREEGYSPAP
jgi:hypothetical protein